jgi:hypothetical protein
MMVLVYNKLFPNPPEELLRFYREKGIKYTFLPNLKDSTWEDVEKAESSTGCKITHNIYDVLPRWCRWYELINN